VIENRVLIFAFQGTDPTFFDWLMNLLYCSAGGIHIGFLTQVFPIYRKVRRVLSVNKGHYDFVVLTGFSQGAAIAAIFGDFWVRRKIVHPSRLTCYLFGGPRPFRLWRKAHINGFHYKNGGDIVTMVPFRTMLYKHGIKPLQLREKRFHLPSIKDHLPSSYKEAIWALDQ
jgi:predicted lipase